MIIRADARQMPLRDGCVQMVCTSPPYFGLRNYGDGKQIGLEPTHEAYVASLVAVFREVRRVLKDDGTVWLNLGDTYSAGKPRTDADCKSGGQRWSNLQSFRRDRRAREDDPHKLAGGLEPKNLIGIPWRVAFALQADGWYLRSDIIWHKPNPMPESVTDRPTKAHEYVFLLAKGERYYYDADAIAEPVSVSMLTQVDQGYEGLGLKDYAAAGVQNPSSVKQRIIENARRKADAGGVNGRNVQAVNSEAERRDAVGTFNNNPNLRTNLTRNKRSVWTIPTMPYSGAHFATMPEALITPCVLAGCPLGGLVCDPFIGSGTVGAVAERLGRRWVGTDLTYQGLARARTAQRGLRFERPA